VGKLALAERVRLYAQFGNKDEAFQALQGSIDPGFDRADDMKNDEDLKSFRNDPRFC